jgi:hypothetical protein
MSLLDLLLGRTTPVSGDMSGSGGTIQPTGATAYQPLATEPASADGSGGGASSVFQMLYGSPEYKRQALQSGLMGLAAGLLKGAGPSTTPTSFLSALGQGLSGAQQGIEGSRNNFARDMMLGAQFDSNRQNMAIQRQWMDFMRRQAGQGGAGAPGGVPGTTPQPAGAGAGGGTSPPNPNNPGNMIDGRGGFQTFATPQEGVAAMIGNALRYGPQQTISQIAARWAPADDGRNPMLRGNDPQQWARNVAAISGLPADQPIDLSNPQVALAFARGVHAAEKGQAAAFSPDIYQQGVQMALSRGAPALAQRGIVPVGTSTPGGPTQLPPVSGPQGAAGMTPIGPATGAGLTVPRVTSPEQLQALPPGTQFIAPDGSVRVR